MFGLAGLSLQKSKLHWLAVAEGLKTLEVLYYLSVVAVSLYKSIGLLWVVSRWSIIAEKIRQNAACLKNSNFILSKGRNLKKSVGFAGFGYTVQVQFRLLEKWNEKGRKKSLVRKRIIVFGCLSKLSWLLWVILESEDWLQKKDSSHWRSGCRR